MPHIDNDVKLDFKDVLLRPKRSTLKSRSEVDLTRSFSFRNSKHMYTGIPIIAANMDTVGTFEMAKVLCKFSLFTAVHKHYSLEQWKEFASQNPDCLEHLAASSGTGSSDFEQLEQILDAIPQVKYICLDVANGYSEHFVEFVKDVRKRFPEHTIMAGNVVTGEMVEELILSGADIIKVGIGPGKPVHWGPPATHSVASTPGEPDSHPCHVLHRLCVYHPEENRSGVSTAECGDGVCRCCARSQRPHHLGWRLQLSRRCGQGFWASEGKTVEVPFKGAVEHTIRDILGGIRSTCTYVGAAKLKELSRRTTFIRVTQQVNPIFSDES
ncbi:GMP reductase 2 isoform X2 [Phacochoerus africanus]|uniref:GMP reductase 2 isoform X2 n=1 Tax=Phacochoerus africanus TaxID=41426 RepID=UPI001FD9D5D2|nr:GMP reductase 2 isoform X2 [Phacochoerus africanus]